MTKSGRAVSCKEWIRVEKGHLAMQRIAEDIKTGQFKQIYLLYGEERYLVRQYRDRLLKALLGDGNEMNLNRYEGKGVAVPDIIAMAETLPFFSDRRVIILENTGLLKSGGNELSEYLKKPSESSSFILVEQEVDKRSSLYKTIKNAGYAAEFVRQKEETLKKWVCGILKKEKKQISSETLQLFLNGTGDDMENIRKELEKLLCYCMDKDVITSGDVKEICVPQIQDNIFKMIGAIADGNGEKALQFYYDLLALRVPPMKILNLLTRQFNLMLQVKEMAAKGYPQALIEEKTGIRRNIGGIYMRQASRFKTADLRQALEDCAETEYAFKSGRIGDRLSLELLIVKYSSLKKKRA